MMCIILTVLTVCLFSGVCYKIWFSEKKAIEPPDLSGRLPFIGHAYKFLGGDFYAAIKHFSEECLKKDGLATARIGFVKWYFTTDPEAFLTLSNKCLEKHYLYKFTKPFFGNSLPAAEVTTWKNHRKLLNPSFSIAKINDLIKIFNDRAKILVDLVSPHSDKPYNYNTLIRYWTLETMCLTTTGLTYINHNLRDKHLYLENKLLKLLGKRINKIWLHSDFIYKMSDLSKETDKFVEEFKEFSNLVIKDWKNVMKTSKKETRTFTPFLEQILDIQNKHGIFTDEQIRDEIDTLIAAGFDTSAVTLTTLFVILGSYPDVQHRVYNEILGVLGGSEMDLQKDDLSKLVFTEAVLKETLRLYPAIPIVARNIDKDIALKNYTIKKNTTCMLSIYGLNRNPNWGPDADQFRPERWLDAATLPDHNNFGTFSIGKRNCIGKSYALIFIKTVLVHVIRQFQISADINKVVFKWNIVMSPVSGHHITLKRRERERSSL